MEDGSDVELEGGNDVGTDGLRHLLHHLRHLHVSPEYYYNCIDEGVELLLVLDTT